MLIYFFLNKTKTIHHFIAQILTAKKTNSEADTTTLEAEIDRLVYELYDLTEEEIQIVEESVKWEKTILGSTLL